jgi:hypothetical protein
MGRENKQNVEGGRRSWQMRRVVTQTGRLMYERNDIILQNVHVV